MAAAESVTNQTVSSGLPTVRRGPLLPGYASVSNVESASASVSFTGTTFSAHATVAQSRSTGTMRRVRIAIPYIDAGSPPNVRFRATLSCSPSARETLLPGVSY